MKMLLCSIGSQRRMTTLRFGVAVAQALAADVTLLGVVSDKQQMNNLEQAMREIAGGLTAAGLSARVCVEAGDAEKLVMAEMEETMYDLVAIGALAGKRSRRYFYDTVAMRIIEMARNSVLIIKGKRPTLSRVLIGASGAEYGHLSIWAGAAVACGAGAQATVLHVADVLPSMYTGLEQMEETLAEILATDTDVARELKWAAQVVKAECEASELKLRRGIVADEILRESEIGDYDLIVLGSSHSAGGLVRALMGDVTRDIVHRAQIPVLVVRPKD
jgi:nucleotide-binding universal stress UspA family protein